MTLPGVHLSRVSRQRMAQKKITAVFTGGRTGNRNFKLIEEFYSWVERDATGDGFDSSTAFTSPNYVKRFPMFRGYVVSGSHTHRRAETEVLSSLS